MGLEFWTVLAVALLGAGGLLLLTSRERARAAELARRLCEEHVRAHDEAQQLRRLMLSWTWEVIDQVPAAPALANRAQGILEFLETLDSFTEARVERIDLAAMLPSILAAHGIQVEAEGPAWALVAEAKFERCILSLVQLLGEFHGGEQRLLLHLRVRSDTILLEFEPVPHQTDITGDLRWLMAMQWFSSLGIATRSNGPSLQLLLQRNDPNPAGPSGAVRAVRIRAQIESACGEPQCPS